MFNRPGSSVYLREDRLELILEPKVLDPGKKYLVKAYLYVVVEGEDEDGCPNMDEVIPDTVLIFDHMEEDMFSFRDMSGKKFLLHRGDVNMIESA